MNSSIRRHSVLGYFSFGDVSKHWYLVVKSNWMFRKWWHSYSLITIKLSFVFWSFFFTWDTIKRFVLSLIMVLPNGITPIGNTGKCLICSLCLLVFKIMNWVFIILQRWPIGLFFFFTTFMNSWMQPHIFSQSTVIIIIFEATHSSFGAGLYLFKLTLKSYWHDISSHC